MRSFRLGALLAIAVLALLAKANFTAHPSFAVPGVSAAVQTQEPVNALELRHYQAASLTVEAPNALNYSVQLPLAARPGPTNRGTVVRGSKLERLMLTANGWRAWSTAHRAFGMLSLRT